MDHAPRFLRLCEEARARVSELTAEEYLARQAELQAKGQPQLRLIDVREDHEWEAGRIPGAQHLSRGILERDIERAIPDDSAGIVLYCGGGFRSALAAESLSHMGYKNVYSLAGGFRGWKDAGNTIETAESASKNAD